MTDDRTYSNVSEQEFANLKPHNTVYKMVGPVFVKQEPEEAKSNVDKRLEFIRGEITRVEQQISDLNKKSEKIKTEVVTIQNVMASQQQSQTTAHEYVYQIRDNRHSHRSHVTRLALVIARTLCSTSTMAEQASVASSNEITLNIKGPSELKLSITISTDKTVLELKQAIAEKSDVSADRQRLIYSGRVLKDEDVLSTYKVQNAHTVHMVKGAPKPTGTAPLRLPRRHNLYRVCKLARHRQRRYSMDLADTGLSQLQNMLSSPQFMQQMSRMMSDPNLMDTILAQSPHLTNMDPNMRRTLQSPEFRQMMSNPDTLRNMMQMTATLRQAGINPMGGGAMGGGFGGGGFGGMPFDLFGGGLGGAQNQGQNQQPSGNLFEQAATGATSAASPASNPNPTSPAANTGSNPNPTSPGTQNPNPSPFGMIDPQGNAAGGNPFAALGAFGAPPAPPDPRPVEERFQVQLQQLQDMGFTNAQQNVRALLACGGRVDSAIEYILGGGGLQIVMLIHWDLQNTAAHGCLLSFSTLSIDTLDYNPIQTVHRVELVLLITEIHLPNSSIKEQVALVGQSQASLQERFEGLTLAVERVDDLSAGLDKRSLEHVGK
ncbi:Heat shock chaperonin-binding motif [Rhizoctonia solani]|uniref:Heat shock chaperonin-binding motif n=1 Tax=Rhizoctonia solani TaxID=456999 RepID=A0A8H7IB34_9AGAM|nr:Heat shock chaperonin-binding motif [Rhizoctonia solani]